MWEWWNSLVDSTSHVLYVLGLVLHTTMVVVGLHTSLDLTPDSGTQLGTEGAFLKGNYL